MNYLANGHLDEIPVPGTDATVTFRADATLADELELVRVGAELEEQDLTTQEKGRRIIDERTLLMVDSWSFLDAQGNPLPVTAEALRTALKRRVANWITEEAGRRYEGRPPGEEGPFGQPSRPVSTATT